ncbi:MAG TPA: cysteine rich repeat-containing protein [Thermodesulfovibrionales bacterium]|nr:cysteine rich repeat-containing protein [Thermodesulfovibrionales bacterium]
MVDFMGAACYHSTAYLTRREVFLQMKKACLLSVVSILIFVISAIPAISTAGQTQAGQGNNPCDADIKKLCQGVKPGEGHLMECLREHKAELSPACADKMTEQKDKMKVERKKCEPDVQKFCPDVKPGGGRIVACLKNHQSELSQECKDSLAKGPGGQHPPK